MENQQNQEDFKEQIDEAFKEIHETKREKAVRELGEWVKKQDWYRSRQEKLKEKKYEGHK